MAISAHHVGLTVANLERSVAWYREALGFQAELEFALPGEARGAMLGTEAGARIELFEVAGAAAGMSWADPPTAMRTLGFGHVALETEDLDGAYTRACEAGARRVWDPRQSPEPGRRMAFLHDPDGNLIELIGPRE
jgi:glyoxylase I family protein